MSDMLALALAFSAGALLGAFFFGGLWWTVQRGLTSERPASLFLGSLLVRTGMILAGFYYVSQGHWSRLAACLLGFLLARVIVMKWLTRGPAGQDYQPESERDVRPENLTYEEENRHAP